ncbi:hypothetical protein MUN84_15000 [Hymenobacter sp. 5516J-16]|uniref:hypothetical protein n=1 Tax=Hymenobacter sp. 5516J-16 TaxID=2932253 RepID=UPI001FCFEAF0|nr:hypothetical protein [Hymenobacter sp. 5516J-16]UOQ75926.1 hypothetical protein MUN84_15000 [Hymenobacter sp. 5516J-16]
MLKPTLLAAGLVALLALPAAAQSTNSGTDKFAQLETLLPTPIPTGRPRARPATSTGSSAPTTTSG